jgi:hypothetical protein
MSNKEYEDMVVIFIDILGSQDRNNFDTCLSVHETFHKEMKIHEDMQLRSMPKVTYERYIRSFSDCAYIIYKLKDKSSNNEESLIYMLFYALYNTSLSIIKFLENGFLVRGGAAIGKCYFDEFGFFGPGIITAYTLESKIANYPRLVIEESVALKLEKKLENFKKELESGITNAVEREIYGKYIDTSFIKKILIIIII